MPLPTIANVHRNAISGTLAQGTHWANIVHCRWTGTGTPTTVQRQAMIDALVHTWSLDQGGTNSRLLYYMATGTKLTQVTSTPLDNATASIFTTYNLPGVQVADPMPGASALVVSLHTALRGRRNRGRLYLSGFNETENDGTGNPRAAVTTAATNQFEATRIALLAVSFELVVASYGVTPPTLRRPAGATWAPYATTVTGVTVRSAWNSQRRRN